MPVLSIRGSLFTPQVLTCGLCSAAGNRFVWRQFSLRPASSPLGEPLGCRPPTTPPSVPHTHPRPLPARARCRPLGRRCHSTVPFPSQTALLSTAHPGPVCFNRGTCPLRCLVLDHRVKGGGLQVHTGRDFNSPIFRVAHFLPDDNNHLIFSQKVIPIFNNSK